LKGRHIRERTAFIYIHPLVHLLGIASPAQVFWEANALIPNIYRIKYVSFLTSVKSTQGLSLSEIEHIKSVQTNRNDLIIIPGVDLNKYVTRIVTESEKSGLRWLNDQRKLGLKICAIGSGTLLLAEAGILNSLKCTTHWKCYKHIYDHFPEINLLENKIFIKDNGIITSAGMSASIDTILSIIEDHHGPIFVSKLARELLIFVRRFGHESQNSYYLDYKTHFNPIVHKVQDVISSNLSKNFTNAKLADNVGTSERNMTRIFKNTLGISISEFKNKLRIELVRHLAYNKSLTRAQIAAECGFTTTKQLKRILRNVPQ